MHDYQVSVVILTYNSLSYLDPCLRSVFTYNDIGESLEVIIVDNCSDDREALKDYLCVRYPGVKLILNAENRGYGEGNNAGIRAASSNIVMVMNPDVTLYEPLFAHAVSSFRRDPALALLGLQQYNQYRRKAHSFLMRRLTVSHFLINFVLQKLSVFSKKYSVVPGPCFFIRKDSFLAAGGYDSRIFLYGEERYLHEMLLRSGDPGIGIDFSKGYIHPIEDRPFSMDIVRRGLDSYFYTQQLLHRKRPVVKKEVVRYYRFLSFFYRVKRKRSTAKANLSIAGYILKNY